jgi:hypothetical protein
VADALFASVVALLHFEGANGSTTFTDSATRGRSVTAAGNAQISTAQSRFGSSSLYLDGSGDCLRVGVSGHSFSLAGDFCVEGWARLTGGASLAPFAATVGSGVWHIGRSAAGFLTLYSAVGTAVITGATTVPNDTWVHWVWERVSGVHSIYLDGVSQGTHSHSTTISPTTFVLGATSTTATNPMAGYLDEVRITTGVSRYGANFTPPTAPFDNYAIGDPYIDDVVFLVHADDSSGTIDTTTKLLVELRGTLPAQVSFVQINTGTTGTIVRKFGAGSLQLGSSGFLTGYLEYTDAPLWDFGADDFTFEFWVFNRVDLPSGNRYIFSKGASSGPLLIYQDGGNKTVTSVTTVADGTQNLPAGSNPALAVNTWNHYALVRSGTTITRYINGAAAGSITVTSGTALVSNTTRPCFGNNFVGASSGWYGMLDEIRITRGLARYTAAFTPQASAFADVNGLPTAEGFSSTAFGTATSISSAVQQATGFTSTIFGVVQGGIDLTGVATGWTSTGFGTGTLVTPTVTTGVGFLATTFGLPFTPYVQQATGSRFSAFGSPGIPLVATGWVGTQFGSPEFAAAVPRTVSAVGFLATTMGQAIRQPPGAGFFATKFGSPFAYWNPGSNPSQTCAASGWVSSFVGNPRTGYTRALAAGWAASAFPPPTAAVRLRPAGLLAFAAGTPRAGGAMGASGFVSTAYGSAKARITVGADAAALTMFGVASAERDNTYATAGFKALRFAQPAASAAFGRATSSIFSIQLGTPSSAARSRSAHCAPTVAFGTPQLQRAASC